MFKFKVADITVGYTPHHVGFFEKRLKNYLCDIDTPEMTISCEVTEKIELPPHEVTSRIKDATVGLRDNGNIIMYLTERSGRIVTYLEHSPDFSYNVSKNVPIPPTDRDPIDDCDREYLRSGSLFNDRLIYLGGTTLHGSCIAYRGRGVIFSAPCGTGKSTHTRLWKQEFSDDVIFVNDDKPAIRFLKDKPTVFGAPWSGKTELNTNIGVPLHAIVFIERAEENSLSPLPTAEAFCYLCDQTFPPFYSNELGIRNVEVVERVIKTVPIYRLRCNLDPSAAHVAKSAIFGE